MRRRKMDPQCMAYGTTRVVLRCAPELSNQLKERATNRGLTLNAYLVDLLSKECSLLSQENHQNRVEHALHRIENRIKQAEIYFECIAEHLSFWSLQWFIHTPPVPVSLKKEASADGKRRWEKFIEVIRERLSKGTSYFSQLIESEAEELIDENNSGKPEVV